MTDAASAHDAFRARKMFGSLDGIRALSILAVVWHHAGPEHLWYPLTRGFLGVDLFFGISGFLIVTLLLREHDATGGISLRRFYARRALRIFPLYYAVLLVSLVASRVSSSTAALQMRDEIPYAFTYVSNWVEMKSLLSITWSLSAEEQFYLAWPSVLLLFGPRRSVSVVVVAIVVSASLVLLHAPLSLELPEFLWQTSFLPILLGVALAHAMHARASFALVYAALGARTSSIATLALLVAALCWPGADIAGVPRVVMQLAMVAFLAACVVREDHALARALQWRPLARIGVLSYGLYLLHMFARAIAAKLMTPLADQGDGLRALLYGCALFVATALLSFVLAELSYRFFESRFLKLKKLFEPGRRSL